MEIILNELSLRTLPPTAAQGMALLDGWLAQMVSLNQMALGKPLLRALTPVADLTIAADSTVFRQWLSHLPREQRLFALATVTAAPVVQNYPEYRFAHPHPAAFLEEECKGLAFAAENQLLAWSFDATGEWTATRYLIRGLTLDETSLEEETFELDAWHLPTTGLTPDHDAYFAAALDGERQRILQAASSGDVLTRRWAEWFPALTLTQKGTESLAGLPIAACRPVADRLLSLHRYFAAHGYAPKNYNREFAFYTTHESETRLNKLAALRFTCPNGVSRLMDWHMRYNPQAGRLYFVPDFDTGTCYIGYIGHKLT